jgi:transcriptional regulator with XRE-family HTH domain
VGITNHQIKQKYCYFLLTDGIVKNRKFIEKIMYTLDQSKTPKPNETIGDYIKRLREEAHISQQELADASGIHIQSLGKLERGVTKRFNSKTAQGIAIALNIPEEYLSAILTGKSVEGIQKKQFCPCCWKAGTTPDIAWTFPRAKYCLICGNILANSCQKCQEPLTSFKHKFCPNCGTNYSQKK